MKLSEAAKLFIKENCNRLSDKQMQAILCRVLDTSISCKHIKKIRVNLRTKKHDDKAEKKHYDKLWRSI